MTDKSREAFEAQCSEPLGLDLRTINNRGEIEYVAYETRVALVAFEAGVAWQAALVSVQPEPDKGPWHVNTWTDGRVVLQSDDFTHDVALVIDGDFGSVLTKQAYGRNIADVLNAALSSSAPSEIAEAPTEGVKAEPQRRTAATSPAPKHETKNKSGKSPVERYQFRMWRDV